MDFLAEGIVRKLNSASPTLIELKLGEFNPPEFKPLDKLEFVSYLVHLTRYQNDLLRRMSFYTKSLFRYG